jgi:HAD superfamily hydrolase (TIGR01662 family)
VAIFLVDLDDTLIDREAAFAAWAMRFVEDHNLPKGSLEWLLEHDFGRGTVTVDGFFDWVTSRYPVPFSRHQLREQFLEDIVHHFPPIKPATRQALARLRAKGWKIAIVTNGSTDLQRRKLEATGVISLVDGWSISEEAGVRKPDPAIFKLAAERCEMAMTGGWMVGDSPDADIVGGRAAGLRTAWVRRGREWSMDEVMPDLIVDTVAEAANLVLDQWGTR